jgi:hypothetical protein
MFESSSVSENILTIYLFMVHIITEKNEVLVAWLSVFHVYGENVGNKPPSRQFPGRDWNPKLPDMKKERHEDIQSTVLQYLRNDFLIVTTVNTSEFLKPPSSATNLDQHPDLWDP